MAKTYLIALAALALSVACGPQEPDPVLGGESHFLTACADDSACGEDSYCGCGVCTTDCTADATVCGEDAVCVEVRAPQMGSCLSTPATSEAICVAECGDDAACGDLVCVGGVCVPPESEDACEARCLGGVCVDRVCTCEAPLVATVLGCIDLNTDPDHCGALDQACGDGERCRDATCVCEIGFIAHEGACVLLNTDAGHCGPLHLSCEGDDVCLEGLCVDACGDERERCDDACVDPSTNPRHCGACGAPCAADHLCVDGQCEAYVSVDTCGACPGSCCMVETEYVEAHEQVCMDAGVSCPEER